MEEGDRQGLAATGLLTKKVKIDIKTSFFDVVSKFQKGLRDISTGIGNFVQNLTSIL